MSESSHLEPKTLVAGDLMDVNVATVTPDETVQAAAKLFLDHGVTTAPVVDKDGAPVGMVSDEDLLGNRGEERRPSWWLRLLASADVADQVTAALDKKVQAVMTSPAITVEPFTPAHEIAELLHANNIASLPVIDGGKLVGLVSRDHLFAAMQEMLRPSDKNDGSGGFHFFESLFAGKKRPSAEDRMQSEREQHPDPTHLNEVSAEEFRHLVISAQEGRVGEKAKASLEADKEAEKRAKAMIGSHLTDAKWRALVETAKQAAEHSENQSLLVQFPAQLCTDGGRALGVKEDGWEKTLQGEPAEIYARWEEELKPKGFALNTRVEVFEDGKVRDYGLVLTWGR